MADKNTAARALGLDADPVMRRQTESYVENQKKADFFKNLSQYLMYGAIAVAGLVATCVAASIMPSIALSLPFGLTPVMAAVLTGVATIGLAAGSVFSSIKGTEISERGNVAYSDIDSKHQAHRMVQAFAKAQTQGQIAGDSTIPFTDSSRGESWSNRVGGGGRTQSGGWAERVAAQAQAEEAQALSGASRA